MPMAAAESGGGAQHPRKLDLSAGSGPALPDQHRIRSKTKITGNTMNTLLANIVVDYFLEGGPIMWPILLAFIIGCTVVIERSLWWLALRQRSDRAALDQTLEAIGSGDFNSAVALSDRPRDPFLKTIHEGLLHAHSSLLG